MKSEHFNLVPKYDDAVGLLKQHFVHHLNGKDQVKRTSKKTKTENLVILCSQPQINLFILMT